MDKKETVNYDSLQYVKYYDSLIRLEGNNHKVVVPYGGIGVYNLKMNTLVR